MFNAKEPDPSELPSSRQLLRSTLIALVAAGAILVFVVLPAEYAIDPTGVGGMLGLTRMGEIKTQLAEEAAIDEAPADPVFTEEPPVITTPATEDGLWRDETNLTLAPDEAVELKLVMAEGDRVEYEWMARGGALNFNRHGDGGGQSIEYGKGRAAEDGSGEIVAAFDGHHGWFWRNRSPSPVQLTLRTKGAYSGIKRTR